VVERGVERGLLEAKAATAPSPNRRDDPAFSLEQKYIGCLSRLPFREFINQIQSPIELGDRRLICMTELER